MLAPSGSARAAQRPATAPGGPASTGAMRSGAPRATAVAVAASASSTHTYVFQLGGPGRAGVGDAMAATVAPRRLATRYLSSAPGGSLFSNSQPKSRP